MLRICKLILIAILSLAFNPDVLLATHVRGGFITITLIDNNNLTYRIALNSFVDTGSTVLFGGGQMDFGDGSDPFLFEAGNPDVFKLLDEEVAMNIYYVEHSFPGPGVYTVGYREFNRNASIANMDNSVNTPFYIETQIKIDPYLGTNSSARIRNYFPFKNNINQPYVFPLSLWDPDGDSISVEPATPLQDKDTPVSNYFVPANFDGNKILSQLQLHRPSNEIVWANPLEEDEYNYAVRIREWRYNSSENAWMDMGYTIFDFQMIFSDRSDNPPVVQDLKDTVVFYSNPFEEDFTILEDNTDSIRVWVSDNFTSPATLITNLEEGKYYLPPVGLNISITDPMSLIRSVPYKIVVSMNPKPSNSTSSQKSMMFWITDHRGKPDAPEGLKVDLAFRNKIAISWLDLSEIEAGYTVERADSFFPKFIRIAALPENTTEYLDENIIPNRDYYYRVKALGTDGSDQSQLLEIKEEDIITGIEDSSPDNGLNFYPNPAHDELFIEWDHANKKPVIIELYDITGKICQKVKPDHDMNLQWVNIPLSKLRPGVYILQINSLNYTSWKRIIKE